MQKKIVIDLTRAKDGTYTMDLAVDGRKVAGLPKNAAYKEIQKAASEKESLRLPPISEYSFVTCEGVRTAHLERRA